MSDRKWSLLAGVGLVLAALGSPGLAHGRSPFFTLSPFLVLELTSDELAMLTAESCLVGESESDDDERDRWADQPQEITVACLRAWLASRPSLEDRIRFVARPTTLPLPYTRPAPGSPEDQRVRAWCARDWPVDTTRRAACVEQQVAAHETLTTTFRPGVPCPVRGDLARGLRGAGHLWTGANGGVQATASMTR